MNYALVRIFDRIRTEWGRLDILVHSIAFAPKDGLQGGLLNCSAGGFAEAMDVPANPSFEVRLAAPLMTGGGRMFAMSYYGGNRVVANYNVMGPVRAALEAACRSPAYELGLQGISRPCDLAWLTEDAGGLGPEGVRTAAQRGGSEGAGRRTCRHHRRRFSLCLAPRALARRITGATVYVEEGRTSSPDVP